MSDCPHCGQPMPVEQRRDPPLPPLDFPAVVTIHDLPEGIPSRVEVEPFTNVIGKSGVRRLVVDGSLLEQLRTCRPIKTKVEA